MSVPRPGDGPPPAVDELEAQGIRAHVRFQRVLGVSTVLMLGLSWPLWIASDDFPRIPIVDGIIGREGLLSWILYITLILSVIAGTIVRPWRPALGLSLAVLAYLVLADQHRLQPWAYQYLLTGLALLARPRGRALGFARLFVVMMYLHSGLSKLDVSFGRELGPEFLRAALGPIGIDPNSWPAGIRTAASLAMPIAELAIAAGLCFGRTRRVALVGALAMHLTLIAILGPWGLGHSTIVLLWNTSLAIEDLILFGSAGMGGDDRGSTAWAGVVGWIFLAAAILPFGERRGIWDAWPSFALYASHVERVDVWIHEDDAGRLPEAIGRHLRTSDRSAWRRLDLSGWSRAVRGVPVYPQGRYELGLAEAIAARYPGSNPLVVDLWGRADRWTGRRDRAELWGFEAIRRRADRYRLNAHPVLTPRPVGTGHARWDGDLR